MSESFTYGEVGGAGGNPGPYPDAYSTRFIAPIFSVRTIGMWTFRG